MQLSDPTQTRAERLYSLVRQIPRGKVSTYGALGKKANINPRQVGYLLHHNPDPATIPCHRVVRADGGLAATFAFGGFAGQYERLAAEEVAFSGQRVNLKLSLWQP